MHTVHNHLLIFLCTIFYCLQLTETPDLHKDFIGAFYIDSIYFIYTSIFPQTCNLFSFVILVLGCYVYSCVSKLRAMSQIFICELSDTLNIGGTCLQLLYSQLKWFDTVCSAGYSSLHLAACWGHLETVRTLLELGADTQTKTFRGERPVDLARRYSKTDCVDCLILAGDM